MHPYLQPLQNMLTQAANPADAASMKKYMLNQFEYFGIRAPKQKEIKRVFFKTHGLPDPGELPEMVKELWNQPQREYQYFAIDLCEKLLKKTDQEIIGLIEFMVVNKSWWDTVDWLASHHTGSYFKTHPHLICGITSAWMESGNIWLQRTCILFQLKYKRNTDEDLLFEYILRLKDNKEFFIRKAIG